MATAEKRQFQMNPKLLLDVIQRQAGTLSKAILEAVMNSVDAGAKSCEITLEEKHVSVSDDGQGFRSRKEIEDWFEVFGQPHDESEHKRYGTFRMGRGQLFSFGRNIWRSGRFQMNVDVKERGIEYDLVPDLEHLKGCQVDIELYQEVNQTQQWYLQQDLERWCKYIPIPVLFNEKQISQDTAEAKWDYVTDEAYVRLTGSGNLRIYNLGCFVREYHNGRYGTGGEVVSRQQLKVNFARNEVQSDCQVWKTIEKLVNSKATSQNIRSKALSDPQRARLAQQLKSGELEWNEHLADKAIFKAANGRNYSLNQLAQLRHFEFYSVGERGEAKADEIMRRHQAFVLAKETLTNFGFQEDELPAFLLWLKGETGHMFSSKYHKPFTKPAIPVSELAAGLSDDHQFLDEGELTANEKLWLALMQRNADLIGSDEVRAYTDNPRKIYIGEGASRAWTDATTYVCVSRRYLKTLEFDVPGFQKLGLALLHAACHPEADLDAHTHDQDFFERFHNAAESVGEFVEKCLQQLPLIMAQQGRKLSKHVAMLQDQQGRLNKAKDEHERRTGPPGE